MRCKLILCLAVLLAACSPPGPTPSCDPERTAVLVAEVETIIAEWDDTNELAGSTGRIALSPVIQRLQDVKRRTENLDAFCAEAGAMQAAMAEYMTLRIDGYLLFMGQKEDGEVSAKFDAAEAAMKDWAVKWVALKEYAP